MVKLAKKNNGQSNLAKGDITCMQKNLVDIFYCIRQVAARVSKLVLLGTIGTPFWGRGGLEGLRWYYSKERWYGGFL